MFRSARVACVPVGFTSLQATGWTLGRWVSPCSSVLIRQKPANYVPQVAFLGELVRNIWHWFALICSICEGHLVYREFAPRMSGLQQNVGPRLSIRIFAWA